MENDTLTGIAGLRVGHYTDLAAGTGCTVVLSPEGARAGVDVRGGAPGSRELALLKPGRLVDRVHAVVLAGGSAFGLAVADGVMRWLEERGYGFETDVARVPIVPAVVLFDLALGDPRTRPDATAGYAACEAATSAPVEQGSVGAGTGATVGKVLGLQACMKGGLGSARMALRDGVSVAALVAVNALGNVVHPVTGAVVAGARDPEGKGFVDAHQVLRERPMPGARPGTHTTLGVVATNAGLDKSQLTMFAGMVHDGLARAIRPVHTLHDGDTIFALSMGEEAADLTVLGAAGAEVMAEAVVRAVRLARGLHGVPGVADHET